MSKMNRHENLEKMLEHFSHEQLLEEVVRGMSDHEAWESFDYIRRMWGFPDDSEDDDE